MSLTSYKQIEIARTYFKMEQHGGTKPIGSAVVLPRILKAIECAVSRINAIGDIKADGKASSDEIVATAAPSSNWLADSGLDDFKSYIADPSSPRQEPRGEFSAPGGELREITLPPASLLELEGNSSPEIAAVFCPYCALSKSRSESCNKRCLFVRIGDVGYYHDSRGKGRSQWMSLRGTIVCEYGHVLRLLRPKDKPSAVVAFPSSEVALAVLEAERARHLAKSGSTTRPPKVAE